MGVTCYDYGFPIDNTVYIRYIQYTRMSTAASALMDRVGAWAEASRKRGGARADCHIELFGQADLRAGGVASSLTHHVW